MTCFEKSVLRLKTKSLQRKYDTFALAERQGENGVFSLDLANNCELSKDGARVGVGVSAFTLASGNVSYDWNLSAPKSFFYHGEKFGFLSDENKVYFYDESTRKFLLAHTFDGEMTAVEAQDRNGEYHLCFVGEAGVYFYEGETEMVLLSQNSFLPLACVFQGRIFTASANAIAFSAPFQAGDFAQSIDDGGNIVFPANTGEVVSVAATSTAVFFFCQYGIWKLTAAGSARDFRLESVGFTGGEILRGSACAVASSKGEKIFFFTESGVFRLDDSGVESICRNLALPLKREGQVCEHAPLDGQVFYSYRALDQSVRGVVIDVETEKAYHAFTAEGVCKLRGDAVAVVDGLVYVIKKGAPLPTWRIAELIAEKTDFQLSGRKTLKSLRVLGEGQITLSLRCGRKTKTFTLQPQNGEIKVDVKMKGEYFRVRFVLTENARLRGLEAELCALVGVE